MKKNKYRIRNGGYYTNSRNMNNKRKMNSIHGYLEKETKKHMIWSKNIMKNELTSQ